MKLRKWILLSVLFGTLVGCGGPWSSGDRVLVAKDAYDTGLVDPHRYDVVVFKYPLGPVEKGIPKNYIKRLLGLPGELIAIFFGRVYRWVPGEGDAPPFDDLKDGTVNPSDLFKHTYTHTNENPAKQWFEEGKDEKTGAERKFEILRKPPQVMLALRRIVYDNDYQARDLKGKQDRWSPDDKSGWKADKDTGYVYNAKPGDDVDWLRYKHLLRPQGPVVGDVKQQPSLITDTMDYNSFQTNQAERTPQDQHWVGDLMIECNVEIAEPKGEFWFELNRGIQHFRAKWDLTSGECTLYRIEPDGKGEELGVQATGVKGPGAYMLRFANFDARLTVWVDRDLPFGAGKEYDPPEMRLPTDKGNPKEIKDAIEKRRGPTTNDLKPASIGCKGAHVKVSHVRLWRDTYYTTSVRDQDYVDDNQRPANILSWSDPTAWEPIRKARFATMYVQPGHYLCLGDNSQASSDSREWGTVPARLMLGRALLVYFPLDRLGPIH